MKNYNVLRDKFVINTIEEFIKKYDGMERGNTNIDKTKGIRIVIFDHDFSFDNLFDRLYDLNPIVSYNQKSFEFSGGSKINVITNDFEQRSRGIRADVVILYNDADYDLGRYLLSSPQSLNKLIIV